jgi:DNA-binding transcriptional MerR regulator
MQSAAEAVDRAAFPYRMKDLCELTGLPRQVIHFYIQQGLVPEGLKTGRNMAYYGESHVERIRLIRKLQHERFLPLKAIKAVLEERDEVFSPAQRRLIFEVKQRLKDSPVANRGRPETVDAGEVLTRLGLERRDLEELADVGLFATTEDDSGRTLIAKDDAWVLELWAELRAIGFSRDLGFAPSDLAIFESAISMLFRREAEILTDRLSQLPAERLATMVERVLPLVNTFLARYHETKVRNFFAAL